MGQKRVIKKTYRCPRYFTYVEKLVVSSGHNLVCFASFSFLLGIVRYLSSKQTSCKRRKWRWNIVVLELIHLPAADLD